MTRTIGRVGALFAFMGVPAAGATADPIEDIINQVSLAEYQSYLRVLTGVDPVPGEPPIYLATRYSFSPQARVAGQWLRDELASFGLDAAVQSFDTSYAPNVVGELHGTTRPTDIYIICAHYDTYNGSGNLGNAPGGDDNGSGVATVLSAARILAQYQFEGTIRFIAFAGEEQMGVGSNAYAHAAYLAGENILGVLNLDMILHPGFDNNDPDADYDLDIGYQTGSLCQVVVNQFATYTSLSTELWWGEGGSDHELFWEYGYAAVGLSENSSYEIWGGANYEYHQASDTFGNPHLDWDFGLQVVRGSMASLITLAGLSPKAATVVAPAIASRSALAGNRAASSIVGTIYVNGAAGQTIQEGIDAAQNGDIVVVTDGVYAGPGNRDLDFGGKAIVVRSENGAPNCILDCEHSGRGFYFHTAESAAATVEGFTIQGGSANLGAGIFCGTDCQPTIINCTITGNTATSAGGGMYCNSQPTVIGCTLTGNTAYSGGAIYCESAGAPTFDHCTIWWNWAYFSGGGVSSLNSDITLLSCSINGNAANMEYNDTSGGGMFIDGGSVTITDCVLAGNLAQARGGGLLCQDYAVVNISGSVFAGNRVETYSEGGGIAVENSAAATAGGCLFTGNRTGQGEGGAVAAFDALTLRNCALAGNAAFDGGAVCLLDAAQIMGCLFAGGSAQRGAGLFTYSPGVLITNCTFGENTAAVGGSAIYAYAGGPPIALANSVLWGDLGTEIAYQGTKPVAVYSDIQGGWSGEGNILVPPAFAGGASGVWTATSGYNWRSYQVTFADDNGTWTEGELVGRFLNPDASQALQYAIVANTETTVTMWADADTIFAGGPGPSAGTSYQIFDYRLSSATPCANTGTNEAPALPDTDLDGQPRIQQCRVDMGAYESPYFGPDCNGNGASDACDAEYGTSPDCNQNLIPDECETANDCNGNGVPDECEPFIDCNGNGLFDACDIASGGSYDCNTNGVPDECDIIFGGMPDCNSNGAPDGCDLVSGFSFDCNANGVPDECEPWADCNGNFVLDECDIISGYSMDCDEDGVPDECQGLIDCNGNGVFDPCDTVSGFSLDCNGNYIPDECEGFVDCNGNGVFDPCDIAGGYSADCNANFVPDECESLVDCNGNGVFDACDLAGGFSLDCNANSVPDECDIAGGMPDCNANGIPDECDIASGNVSDCDADGVPDECEPLIDCNGNGLPDACDLMNGTSADCNANGQPDECDLQSGSSPDCNSNSVPDECDVATGFSPDCNSNGVPDECDIADGTSQDADGNGVPDECERCIGDLNCDGSLNFGDINPFVQYVSGFAAWHNAFPACDPHNGDINCDGTYGQWSLGDINPFITLMQQCGSGCPCPGPIQCP